MIKFDNLQIGSSGFLVQLLTIRLKSLGFYRGPIRQTFNREVHDAVVAFQRTQRLPATGIVNEATWSALNAVLAEVRPTLRLGSTGIYVQELQEMLSLLGYYTAPITLVFDNLTQQAVINFQRASGLSADGVVGPQTWAALDAAIANLPPDPNRPTLRLGSTGYYVRELQEMLNLLGYFAGPINQIFDVATQQAVIAFQTAVGLTADGIVGPQTWAALDKAVEELPEEPERPVLRLGSTGHYVQDLQMMLRLLDFYLESITSIFDEATRIAVIDFQTDAGLVGDGVVGPLTWEALDIAIAELPPESTRPILRIGDTGDAVVQLQESLQTLGFYSGIVNGTFDNLTQQSVISFQVNQGLPPTGIVDSATWNAIDIALETLPPVNPRPTISEGSIGPSVVSLHEMLAILGYYVGPITDIFDEPTTTAVKSFQTDNGLTADGIVGPLTWAALDVAIQNFDNQFPVLRLNDVNPAVRRLQSILSRLGYYTGTISTTFTAATRNAVMDFQSAYGLSVDGVVGNNTWTALTNANNILNQDKFAAVWSSNPSTFTIQTDAFAVIAPVWYQVERTANGQSVYINPRRASATYSQAVHAAGMKVWGTIQSFDANITRQLVTNDTQIQNFITQITTFVVQHELDGVCIDFEYMYVADKDIFSSFVRRVCASLRQNARSRQAQIIMSVCYTKPPTTGDQNNMWSASVDRAELTKICDYACMMLYDEHGPGSAPGPIASIGWVEDGIQKILAEVADAKAILGVPLYSGDWTSHRNSSGVFVLDGAITNLTMNMVASTLANGYYTNRSGNIVRVSRYTVSPVMTQGVLHYEFIDTTDVLHNVWAENPAALSLKLDLMIKYNLPGTSAWEISFGNAAAWAVIKQKINEAQNATETPSPISIML